MLAMFWFFVFVYFFGNWFMDLLARCIPALKSGDLTLVE